MNSRAEAKEKKTSLAANIGATHAFWFGSFSPRVFCVWKTKIGSIATAFSRMISHEFFIQSSLFEFHWKFPYQDFLIIWRFTWRSKYTTKQTLFELKVIVSLYFVLWQNDMFDKFNSDLEKKKRQTQVIQSEFFCSLHVCVFVWIYRVWKKNLKQETFVRTQSQTSVRACE